MDDDLNVQTWLDKYGDYLYSYAFLKVKDRHIAEDMVQETLFAAIAAKNTFSGQSTIRTWLTGILKHKIIDHFRRQSRVTAIGDLVDQDDEDNLDYFFGTAAAGLKNRNHSPVPNRRFNNNNSRQYFSDAYPD